jgi:uncharacterized membrane protein
LWALRDGDEALLLARIARVYPTIFVNFRHDLVARLIALFASHTIAPASRVGARGNAELVAEAASVAVSTPVRFLFALAIVCPVIRLIVGVMIGVTLVFRVPLRSFVVTCGSFVRTSYPVTLGLAIV